MKILLNRSRWLSAGLAGQAVFGLLVAHLAIAATTVRLGQPPTRSRHVERVRFTVSLSSGEKLDFAWPFNWNLIPTDPATKKPGVEIVAAFAPNYNENAQARLNFWREPAPKLRAAGLLRARHREEAEAFVAGSIEQRVDVRELKVAGGIGLISTFTDAKRADQPTERGVFKTTSIATICLSPGVLVTAELLCDSPNRAEFYIGRAILESLRVLDPAAKPAQRTLP